MQQHKHKKRLTAADIPFITAEEYQHFSKAKRDKLTDIFLLAHTPEGKKNYKDTIEYNFLTKKSLEYRRHFEIPFCCLYYNGTNTAKLGVII